MYVLAHLSDPHLAPLPRPGLLELAGKRLGGFINWHRNRRRVHLTAVLERTVHDLRSHSPDHVAVTGDLINLSLADEFAPALLWLERLGPPQDVTLVPGNHDAYVRSKARHSLRYWADYMRGDDSLSGEPTFPFVRRRGPIAMIGLSTAVPAPPFRATGRLGAHQLARFAELSTRLGREGAFRVVLLHHPPITRPEWHNDRLVDGAAFLDVLRQHGAELLLYGHEHVHSLRWLDAPRRPVPAIGVPSASAGFDGQGDPAAYNLYAVDGTPGAWECEVVSRGLARDGESIIELNRTRLVPV